MSAPAALELALARGPLLLGGAVGTELLASGPDGERWIERLNRTHPELVRDVHARFLAAGCDALATNSFRASCAEAPPAGLGDEAGALARRAAELARGACDTAPAPERFALGSLGPCSVASAAEPAGLERALFTAALGLLQGGADALVFETLSHEAHLEAALDASAAAMRAEREVPILASFTVEPDGRTRAGLAPADLARLCADRGLALLALNCSYGPSSLDAPLRRLRESWDGALGAWPNAGVPRAAGAPHPVGPLELAQWVAARTAELDLRLVGGCCGATPAHAAAIARAIRGL